MGYNNSTTSDTILSCYGYILVYNTVSRMNFIAIGSLYIIGSTLSITFNILFLTAMKLNRNLHKLSNYLLSCLSVIDLSSGACIMPACATVILGRRGYQQFCDVETYNAIVGYSLASMSFVVIFVITLEQFLAIVHPFYHQDHVTFKRLFYPMSIAWALLTTTSTVCWLGSKELWVYYQSILGFIIFVTFTSIIYFYARIFTIARRTKRRIRATSIIGKQQRPQKRHNKAIKTTSAIVLAFTLCYVPIGIYIVRRFLFKITPMERTLMYEWVQLIGLWNAVINPLVYYWRLRLIRKELCKIFGIHNMNKTRQSITIVDKTVVLDNM